MVHLSSVPEKPAPKGAADGSQASAKHQDKSQKNGKAHLQLADYEDGFASSVYGSRFADEDLPKDQMAEGPMPRDIAYRLIKDDLSLDNNPKLK